MRILRIINSLGVGGAERSIVNNVPLHVRNGYSMDVLLLDGRRTFFLDQIQSKGVKVEWLGRNISVYNPFLVFRLLGYMGRYDIIHVHLFPSLYWVAFARILSRSKTKLIFTEHNTINRRRGVRLFRWLDRIAYSQYAKVIAVSDASKRELDLQTGDPEKSVVIPNGIQVAELRQSSARLPEDWESVLRGRKVLLQIASFREQKDQDTVIRALVQLSEDYVVVFVGDGPRRSQCESLAKELFVGDRVFFAGLQDDVAAFIRSSRLVIMSSHHEGFGRAAVEAMALGKPVIASKVPGLKDVVGGAGLLFDVGDHVRLAELIDKLMHDKEMYAQISDRCLARADVYDLANMIAGYEGIYIEQLGG